MIRFLSLIGILLAGCTTPIASSPRPQQENGSIEILTQLLTENLEGELGRVQMKVRNRTGEYILLLQFYPEGASSGIQWQISRPGAVTYNAKEDTFQHNRKRASRKQELYNLALLSPGEEISFQTRIRLLHFPHTYELEYFRYPLSELVHHIYMPAGSGLYQKLDPKEMEARLRPQLGTSPSSHRMVLFPFAEQINVPPQKDRVRVQIPLRTRHFPLSSALQKCELSTTDQYTFFARLGLWMIRSGDSAWLVSATRKIVLPTIRNEAALFHFLDAGDHPKVEVVLRKETKTLFAKMIPLVPDPSGSDYLAFIPLEQLLTFFETIREFGLLLDVELGGHGGGRLVVTR